MKKLENKTAVITGGNSGIGLATALVFAENGARVAITGRNQANLDQAIKEIGHNAIAIRTDVTDLNSISESYKMIHQKLGKIDILILNAGIDLPAPFEFYTEEDFDKVSNVNFKGVFFSIQKR